MDHVEYSYMDQKFWLFGDHEKSTITANVIIAQPLTNHYSH